MTTQAYVTDHEADDYFASRFNSGRWQAASSADKTATLLKASIIIDRLNYGGLKAAAYAAKRAGASKTEIRAAANTQRNQFPRNADAEIPEEISAACCEIAFALISGYDPDEELRALATASEAVGPLGLKTTYDRSRVSPWVAAGVPSPSAWQMLVPFLRDPDTISLHRVG